MASRFVLLLLPALVLANIDARFYAELNPTTSSLIKSELYFTGEDVDTISDIERNSFNLNDNNLKNAMKSLFGKRPESAYLRIPTWHPKKGNLRLYQSNGWHQVNRTLKPRSSKILNVSSSSVLVAQNIIRNYRPKPITFNVGITQELNNTASSTWSRGKEISVLKEINYGFEIDIVGDDHDPFFFYASPWGRDNEQVQPVVVGATTIMDLVLEPRQGVISQIYATRGEIQIQLEYEARLSGQAIAGYSDAYKGHYYWALDIFDCMNSSGISNQVLSSEVIDIVFYIDSKVLVLDETNGDKIMEANFNITFL